MLTATDFYRLPYTNQANVLLSQGTFIQSRSEGRFIVDLYELDDLLIEIFYGKETEEIVSVMAYNSADKFNMLTRKLRLAPKLTFKQNPTAA